MTMRSIDRVLLAVADSFDRVFWPSYPRHVAKADARKAWAQLKPSPALVDEIIAALAWQCQTEEWLRDGGRYVPYAGTWIRGERWTDEPVNATRVSQQTFRLAHATADFLKDES